MAPTRFLEACRRRPVDRVPVWMMRQAGRYMKVYRDLKEEVGGFWNLCTTPETAARATLDAMAYLDCDAAIIFSDITLPAWAMGLDLIFDPGPQFENAVQDMAAVDGLADFDPDEKLGFVMEAIRQTRAALTDDKSLIGFVGAPVTLAGYMIEGYPSRNWVDLKRIAYGEPKLMHALLERVTEAVAAHAIAQARAGCDALQLFDTTAGTLAAAELQTFAFDYARKVVEKIRAAVDVPVIYFARDVGSHLEAAASVGADVLGVDWTVSVAEARRRLGDDVALMGNLDPTSLFTSRDEVDARVREILEQARGLPGFIFNLGHGILPKTPPENAKQVVETVHAWQP